MISLTVNGRSVELNEGSTLLDATKKAGVYIPTLCYHPCLPSHAVCRMCLVNVNDCARPQPACVTKATVMLLRQTLKIYKNFVKPMLNGYWHVIRMTVCDVKLTVLVSCRILLTRINWMLDGKKFLWVRWNIRSIN